MMLQKSFLYEKTTTALFRPIFEGKTEKKLETTGTQPLNKSPEKFLPKEFKTFTISFYLYDCTPNIYSTKNVLKWKKEFAESHIAGTVLIGLSKDFYCNLRGSKQKEKVSNLLSAFYYIAFGSASKILSPILFTRNV